MIGQMANKVKTVETQSLSDSLSEHEHTSLARNVSGLGANAE